MKIVFLGVGEAFDEKLINTSVIVSSKKINILLDCGYSVPQQFWQYNSNPDFLDAIYISHHHADHYFGLPPVLIRMKADGRKKKLTIICSKKVKNMLVKMLDTAYQKAVRLDNLNFQIDFLIVRKGEKKTFKNLILEFAPTLHPAFNLAIKITDMGKSVCYSGDGQFTKEGEKLYQGVNLLIHEAYFFNKKQNGHENILNLVKMAEKNKIKCLALTHIQKKVRKNSLIKIKNFLQSSSAKVIIPQPLDVYRI